MVIGHTTVQEDEEVNHDVWHFEGSLDYRRTECGFDVVGVPDAGRGGVATEERVLDLPYHSLVVTLSAVDGFHLGLVMGFHVGLLMGFHLGLLMGFHLGLLMGLFTGLFTGFHLVLVSVLSGLT